MKLLYLISLFITIPGALAFAITIPEDYTAKILKFNDTYYAVNSTQNIIYGPDNDIGSVINHIQNMLPSGSLIKIQCANYKLYTQINLTKSDDIEGIGDSYNCVSFTPQNKVSGSYVIWNSRTALSNISINGNFDHQTYFDVETNGPMEIDNFQLTNPNSTGSNAILVGNRTEIAQLHFTDFFINGFDKQIIAGKKQFNEDWVHFDTCHMDSSNIVFYDVGFNDKIQNSTTFFASSCDFEGDHYIISAPSGINATALLVNSPISINIHLTGNQTKLTSINQLMWDLNFGF